MKVTVGSDLVRSAQGATPPKSDDNARSPETQNGGNDDTAYVTATGKCCSVVSTFNACSSKRSFSTALRVYLSIDGEDRDARSAPRSGSCTLERQASTWAIEGFSFDASSVA